MQNISDTKLRKCLKVLKDDFQSIDPTSEEFSFLFNDRTYFKYALVTNGLAYKYAPEDCKEEPYFISLALNHGRRNKGEIFELIPDKFKHSKEFLATTINNHSVLINHIDEELFLDNDFLSLLMPISIFWGFTLAKKFTTNKKIVMSMLPHISNGSVSDLLKQLSGELKDDLDIVSIILDKDFNALEHCSDRLKNNVDCVLPAIKRNQWLMEGVDDELLGSKEIFLETCNQNDCAFDLLHENLKADKLYVQHAIRADANNIRKIPKEYLQDPEIIKLALLSRNAKCGWEHCSPSLKKDIEFIKQCVFIAPNLYLELDADIRQHKEIIKIYQARKYKDRRKWKIKKFPFNLLRKDENLSKNKGLIEDYYYTDRNHILSITAINPAFIKFGLKEFGNDKDLIRVLINQGRDLPPNFMSKELSTDFDFMTTMVIMNPSVIQFVDISLLKNNQFLNQFNNYTRGCALGSLAPMELKCDRKFVLQTIGGRPDFIEHLPEHLRDDTEIVHTALKSDGQSLEFASERLRDDPETVLIALKFDGSNLKYASSRLRNNANMIRCAVSSGGSECVLKSASKKVRTNKSLVMLAIRRESENYMYVDKKLYEDKEFVNFVIGELGSSIEYKASSVFNLIGENLKYDLEFIKNGLFMNWEGWQYLLEYFPIEDREINRIAKNLSKLEKI